MYQFAKEFGGIMETVKSVPYENGKDDGLF